MLPLLIKLTAAADERELYRYVNQSFRAFEQRAFAKVCEKSSIARGGWQDAESWEEKEGSRSYCYLDGSVLSEVADAMATWLKDHAIACERLEEAVER